MLGVEVVNRTSVIDGGIVDHHIDTSEGIPGFIHHGNDGAFIAEISLNRDCALIRLELQGLHQGERCLFIQIDGDDLQAVLAQAFADGAT